MNFAYLWAIIASTFDMEVIPKLNAVNTLLNCSEPSEMLARFQELEQEAKVNHAALAKKQGNYAVISINGPMLQSAGWIEKLFGFVSTSEKTAEVRAAAADSRYKGIILSINSPGGQVQGTSELAAAIASAKESKPVIAHTSGIAASAAYWAGSQASEFYASDLAEVGSIGVLAMHRDITAMKEMAGIKDTVISSGKYKAELHGALTPEAISHLQEKTDAVYEKFVADVAAGRNASVATVKSSFGEGRMVAAATAKKAGMIDKVMSFDALMDSLSVTSASPDSVRAAHSKRALKFASLRAPNQR